MLSTIPKYIVCWVQTKALKISCVMCWLRKCVIRSLADPREVREPLWQPYNHHRRSFKARLKLPNHIMLPLSCLDASGVSDSSTQLGDSLNNDTSVLCLESTVVQFTEARKCTLRTGPGCTRWTLLTNYVCDYRPGKGDWWRRLVK